MSKRPKFLLTVFSLVLVFQLFCPPYTSGEDSSQRKRTELIQMNFDNIELRDLVRFVSSILGKNFVFDETVVRGKVTILAPQGLSKEEVYRVFEGVMTYFGLSIVEGQGVTKIVRGTDVKGLAIETFKPGKEVSIPFEDRPITHIYHLENVDATALSGILRPLMSKNAYIASVPATNSLILVDDSSNIKRLRDIIQQIDIPISKQLGAIKVFNVQHTNAGDLAKTLQTLLAAKKPASPKEQILISSYSPTNSLLISAPPEDMKEIERIIQEIDTYRPQVLVEAAIVEVSTTKGLELGVEWLGGVRADGKGAIFGGFVQQGGSLVGLGSGVASAIESRDPSKVASSMGALKTGLSIGILGDTIKFMGKEYPSLAAFIRALSTVEKVNILSTPQILTLNNEEAEIIVGENRPYLTSTRLDAAGNPIYSYDYRDIGVKLKVKPSINKDGFVYLNIYQEVTKVSIAATSETGATSPTTLKRSTKTTVGVKDSQTIVISGLISDDETGTNQGIPILSSIPIIGNLFGYKSTTKDKKNLLVFITPRIVYHPEHLEEITRKKKEEQEKLMKDRKGEREENS
ncbi:MAG: secretin N-terminal domain-containing protein [candidate division WOR-3 bacterium]